MPPGLAWRGGDTTVTAGGGICTALCKTGFLLVYLGKIVTDGQTVSNIYIDYFCFGVCKIHLCH